MTHETKGTIGTFIYSLALVAIPCWLMQYDQDSSMLKDNPIMFYLIVLIAAIINTFLFYTYTKRKAIIDPTQAVNHKPDRAKKDKVKDIY